MIKPGDLITFPRWLFIQTQTLEKIDELAYCLCLELQQTQDNDFEVKLLLLPELRISGILLSTIKQLKDNPNPAYCFGTAYVIYPI